MPVPPADQSVTLGPVEGLGETTETRFGVTTGAMDSSLNQTREAVESTLTSWAQSRRRPVSAPIANYIFTTVDRLKADLVAILTEE